MKGMTHLRLVEISSLNHSQHWFAAVLLMLAEESPANNITLQEMRDPRTLSVKGMSLTHIHQIVSEWGGREALEGLTTTQVCDRFLKPMTLGSGLSLCAQLFVSAADHAEQAKFVSKTTVTTVARKTVVCGHRSVTATTTTVKTTLAPLTRKDGTYSVRDATWFISHAWQFKFLDVLDALDHFCERQTLAPSAAILWIDLFSNSQHDTHLKEFLWWQETFIHAIKKIGNVALILQPWHDPLPLTRCWCAFEIYAANVTNSNFEIAMTRQQSTLFMAAVREEPMRYFDILANIRCEKSEAFLKSDKDAIFGLIEATVGFANLNQLVLQTLASWLISALEIRVSGSEGADLIDWMWSLSYFYEFTNRRSLAEETFNQCLDACIKMYGKSHEKTIMLMDMKADILASDGLFDAAFQLLDEAINTSQATFGPFHPRTLTSLCTLSFFYRKQGNYSMSEKVLVECVAVSELHLGKQHPVTLDAMNHLSILRLLQGHLAESDILSREVFSLKRKVYGDFHIESIFAGFNLAASLREQGKYSEAEPIIFDCLAKCESTMGGTSRMTATIEMGVAQLRLAQKCYAEAELYLSSSIAWLNGDKSHPNGLIIVKIQTDILINGGKLTDAGELLNKNLADCQAHFGATHPLVLDLQSSLGHLYFMQGNLLEAEVVLLNCLSERQKVLGETHPSNFRDSLMLAKVLMQGKKMNAEDILKQCLVGCKIKMGHSHPFTIEVEGVLEGLILTKRVN